MGIKSAKKKLWAFPILPTNRAAPTCDTSMKSAHHQEMLQCHALGGTYQVDTQLSSVGFRVNAPLR